MKSTRIIFAAVILLCNLNLGKCTEDVVDVAIETEGYTSKYTVTSDYKATTLDLSLTEFKKKYSQFDYGVKSMEGLYDAIENPRDLYGEMNHHSLPRSVLFCCQLLTGGACEVVKCLSVFHPEVSLYGQALIGLYAAKSVFWGVDSWLNDSAKKTSIGTINALQTDPQLFSQVSIAASQVNNIDVDPILKISNSVAKLAKSKTLSDTDRKRLDRLTELSDKLGGVNSFKKIFLFGGKILSFLTGIATGITVAITGQNSAPAYYLTLIAGGLDSIVDSTNIITSTKPIMQKYITVSELIYLSDYFLKSFKGEVEV